jgi:hypothetical protein
VVGSQATRSLNYEQKLMRYRRPFTPEQRRDAAEKYRSYLSHCRLLAKTFAPRNPEERKVFRERMIRDFGLETAREVSRINASTLNDLELRLNDALTEYFGKRMREEK